MNAELLEDVPHVHLRRGLADEERLRDLAVATSLSEEVVDLALAWREPAVPPQLARHLQSGAAPEIDVSRGEEHPRQRPRRLRLPSGRGRESGKGPARRDDGIEMSRPVKTVERRGDPRGCGVALPLQVDS